MLTSAFSKVRARDGLVILGTSETSRRLEARNFPHRLAERLGDRPCLTLAGAGRASYVWIPWLLEHPGAVRGLRLLYYINPTYWRPSLNRFRDDYYHHFNSPRHAGRVRELAERAGLGTFVAQARPSRDPKRARALRRLLDGSECARALFAIPSFLGRDGAAVTGPTHLRPIDSGSETFQSRALAEFLRLLLRGGARPTVFLGPYAARAEGSTETLLGYARLGDELRRLCDEVGVAHIDGTDLSTLDGGFSDPQHFSAGAAQVIAERISTSLSFSSLASTERVSFNAASRLRP